MLDLGWLELAVVLVAVVCAAGVAVLMLVDRVPPASAATTKDDHVAITVSGNQITSASPAAAALMEIFDGVQDLHDWAALERLFSDRFPEFPPDASVIDAGMSSLLVSRDPARDPATLMLCNSNGFVTVQLIDPRGSLAMHHLSARSRQADARIDYAAEHAPHPIWVVGQDGTLDWGNAAYWDCARKNLGSRAGNELLFDPADLNLSPERNKVRVAIAAPEGKRRLWFDVTRVTREKGDTIYFATEVSAVVHAEAAQRNFLQTLTKTFAHLSIGLAIFDRDRQLALFNPALIDLTNLSPEYLSKRPNLMTFFDGLRENQVMPEPKNYSGWRETLADVVIAASDGRYSETWNLPSGLTYRVTGRPHPDGAIAFLFEDISAEISLTRRFREELEIGHSVLDTFESAIAVFTPSGRLSFSNAAYNALWGVDSDVTPIEITAQSTTELWQSLCQPTPVWSDIRDMILSYGQREPWSAQVRRHDGRTMQCHVQPLQGGATLVRFDMAPRLLESQVGPVSA